MNWTQEPVGAELPTAVPAPRTSVERGSAGPLTVITSRGAARFTRAGAPTPNLLLRAAVARDAEPLRELIAGLSVRSAFMRFLAGVRHPSERLLARLLQVDDSHGAHVAVATDGRLVAHAMWAMQEESVELGVVVTDAWQGRGIGSALVRSALTEAAVAGACTVRMDVHVDNRRLARHLSRWPGVTADRDGEMLTFWAPMRASADGGSRAAGRLSR
jgi:GNAT superfamily N-acetyltransferase